MWSYPSEDRHRGLITKPDFIVGDVDGPACRILVVDDEKPIRDLLVEALSRAGHTVQAFPSARDALEAFQAGRYDLALIDVRMPKLDGIELFQILRERDPHLASHVVFMTGDIRSMSTQTLLSDTGRPALIKPFDLIRLEEIIQDVRTSNPSTGPS